MHLPVQAAAHGEAAEVFGIIEVGNEHLERFVGIVGRTGHHFENRLEQRREVHAGIVEIPHGDGVASDGVQHGEFELFFRRVQIDEQIVHFVQDFLRAGVLAVDLVDDHNDLEAAFEGLAEHETGLRQRAFRRVHQQDRAVGHGQGAFDFAAEVGVAGGVNDVDLDAAPAHGAVLGRDGDAAFAFDVHAVHDAIIDLLIASENAALAEKGVHKRGLAVVNVGNDGDITKFFVAGELVQECILMEIGRTSRKGKPEKKMGQCRRNRNLYTVCPRFASNRKNLLSEPGMRRRSREEAETLPCTPEEKHARFRPAA